MVEIRDAAASHRVAVNSAPAAATVYLDGTMVLGPRRPS